MAAANESQGLKIAVACFIALSVILTVTSYFLYTAYSSAEAKLQSANDQLADKSKTTNLAVTQFEELRTRIGTKAQEADPAKEEINAHLKKVDERIGKVAEQIVTATTKVQEKGAQGPELEEYKQNIQKAISSYRSEPNKNYISSLDRLAELMENVSLLSTELSVNYLALRKSLESDTTVNKEQVNTQTVAAKTAHDDVVAEQNKHQEERKILHERVDKLNADNDAKTTEITNLTKELAQVLDRPDGYVTYVDYERGEVLVNLTRRQGARPQMKMTIFDQRSPGIPTEKPKGNIELTAIGEQYSTARIIKTDNPIDPIRVGDIVYSAAWSPNQPMRFALIGKMDVNRDGKDDRDELKRMIQEAGGVVDYDLPTPDVGKETGTLSPRIDWYVTDDRMPLREVYQQTTENVEVAKGKFEKRRGEVTGQARLDGIRPMRIERLLAFLGYDMSTPIVGRAEAVDTKALRRLTAPRRPVDQPAATKSAGDTTKAETKAAEKSDEMQDDANKDDQPKKSSKKAPPKKKSADDDPQ
jgi:hypothetical protein